jgi:hypothetical protein
MAGARPEGLHETKPPAGNIIASVELALLVYKFYVE